MRLVGILLQVSPSPCETVTSLCWPMFAMHLLCEDGEGSSEGSEEGGSSESEKESEAETKAGSEAGSEEGERGRGRKRKKKSLPILQLQ